VMVANAPRTTDYSFDSINQGCSLPRKRTRPVSYFPSRCSFVFSLMFPPPLFFYLPLPSRHNVAHVLGGGKFISPSQLSCYLRNLIISSWYEHWISHFGPPPLHPIHSMMYVTCLFWKLVCYPVKGGGCGLIEARSGHLGRRD
jgi:hypothetical protein